VIKMWNSSVDHYGFAKPLAFAFAGINAAVAGVYLYKLRQTMSSAYANGAEILWDTTIPWIRIRIAIALILAAIALLSRRLVGLLASVASLSWALVEYARWITISREATLASSTSQIVGLFGIEWWSLLGLVFTIALLTWEAIILIRSVLQKALMSRSR
jgi:hypothetical protein